MWKVYILEGGVGNGLEGCVNEEAVTPDIRGGRWVQAGGNSQHPANLNRATAIPGPTVMLLHLITCRLEVNLPTRDVVEKRDFYNIKFSVSVVGGFNASQIVDEGQRSSSGWGKPQLYRALHHLIIKMLKRFALTGALWSWDLCKSPILFFMIHILTTKLSWNRRYTYMIILLFL